MKSWDELESIDLVFENCEWIRIPIEFIDCYLDDIYESAYTGNSNVFFSDKTAKKVIISISNKFFEISKDAEGMMFSKNNLKDRLVFRDITHVEFHGKNGEKLYIAVIYKEEYPDEISSPNCYQKNEWLEDRLLIDIRKKNAKN